MAYRKAIKTAALAVCPAPSRSPRLDVEIIYAIKDRNLRADVDNVTKPILDVLKGVIYEGDRQVRSVSVTALPLDDAFKMSGEMNVEMWDRLLTCKEFLVIIRVNHPLRVGV